MGVEQARDARLERIKFAATRLTASPCKARSRQPDRDRAPMKPEGASGLRNRQALAMVTIVDLPERLVIDHDRGPAVRLGHGPRAAEEARMSWPSRSKRSVVRAISSCNGVPAIWAIKPIRTAGCANMTSCSAGRAKSIVLFVESTSCANERSCNATPAHRRLRQ